MKIHTRKFWLRLAALCAAGGAFAKPMDVTARGRSANPVPSPGVLVERINRAFDHISPVRVVVQVARRQRRVKAIDDRRQRITLTKATVSNSKEEYYYNDPFHYEKISHVRGNVVTICVNGGRASTYDRQKRKYWTYRAGPAEHDERLGILTFIARSLKLHGTLLARGKVACGTFRGKPAFVLTITGAQIMVPVKTIVDRRTYLILWFETTTDPPVDTKSFTATYYPQSKPFPLSDLSFTPPAGTKTIAVPYSGRYSQ